MRRRGIDYFNRDERFFLDSSFQEEKLTIKNEMERRGLTLAHLSAKYGVSTSFLRDIFVGTRASKDIYLRLEKDFDVVLLDREKPLARAR